MRAKNRRMQTPRAPNSGRAHTNRMAPVARAPPPSMKFMGFPPVSRLTVDERARGDGRPHPRRSSSARAAPPDADPVKRAMARSLLNCQSADPLLLEWTTRGPVHPSCRRSHVTVLLGGGATCAGPCASPTDESATWRSGPVFAWHEAARDGARQADASHSAPSVGPLRRAAPDRKASFARARARWLPTVELESPSSYAMTLLECPRAAYATTCRSRSVRPRASGTCGSLRWART